MRSRPQRPAAPRTSRTSRASRRPAPRPPRHRDRRPARTGTVPAASPTPDGGTAPGRAPRPGIGRRRARRRSPTAATPARCAPARAPGRVGGPPRPAGQRGPRRGTGRAAAGSRARSGGPVRRQGPGRSRRPPAAPSRTRLHPAAGCAPPHRPRRRAARTPPGRHRPPPGSREDARSRAPGHSRQTGARDDARSRAAGLTAAPGLVREFAENVHHNSTCERGPGSRCESGAVPPLSPAATPRHTREPGTAPPRRRTRDEDPEKGPSCVLPIRGRPGDPAAVHVGHGPALRPRLGRPVASREPEPGRRPPGAARRGRRGRGPRPRRPPLLGRRHRRRARVRQAGGRAGRRAGARRGDDGAVDGARRGCRAGPHVPRAGGSREPRPSARLPLRHRIAHRRGLRAPGRAAELGDPRACGAPFGRPDDRRPLLPGPAARRQHRLRRGAVHRRRRRRGSRAPRLLRLAPPGRGRPARDVACGRRDGRHRSRGGRDEARGRRCRRGRRGLGRRCAGRAGRPDPAGPLPDEQPRELGGERRRALAARCRHAGRRARVRRPADHRAVLVQGVRRRRPVGLRARPRAGGAGRRDRGPPCPAAPYPERGQADRPDAQRVPDQARADRQRGRPGHAGQRRRAAAGDGGGRLRRRRPPGGRGRGR